MFYLLTYYAILRGLPIKICFVRNTFIKALYLSFKCPIDSIQLILELRTLPKKQNKNDGNICLYV